MCREDDLAGGAGCVMCLNPSSKGNISCRLDTLHWVLPSPLKSVSLLYDHNEASQQEIQRGKYFMFIFGGLFGVLWHLLMKFCTFQIILNMFLDRWVSLNISVQEKSFMRPFSEEFSTDL